MAKHNITYASGLYQGASRYAKYNTTARSERGVEVDLPIFKLYGAPIVADADGICASQAGTAATAMTINGAVGATLDFPRNVVAAWTGTAVLTVTGTDEYGEVMVESSASGTSFTGKKAFKTITSVVPSANITSATVGTGDVIGLPFRIADKNQVIVRFDGAADAATVVKAVDTAATATTGDVRGTIDPAGTLDGTKTLAVMIFGVNRTTKELAFGVTQYRG